MAIHLGNDGFYPEINAWFCTIVLPWFNLLSLCIILENNSIISKGLFKFLLFSSTSLWLFSFKYFIYKEKYLKIIEEGEKKKWHQSSVKTIVAFIYAILSVAVYFYLS